MTHSSPSAALGCTFLIDLDPRYVRMAMTAIKTIRRHDPDLPIVVLVAAHDDRDDAQQKILAALRRVADDVRHVPPLHLESGYFPDNKAHLDATGFDRLIYLDADTVVFGSLRSLAERYEDCDVAARPSEWSWRFGYTSGLAPGLLCPIASSVVVMSDRFATEWAAQSRRRSAAVLDRPDRAELARWLRVASPGIPRREEFAFSEFAWNGSWAVGLLGERDCQLVDPGGGRDDPNRWRRATVLHTYATEWERSLARLGVRDPSAAGGLRADQPQAGQLGAVPAGVARQQRAIADRRVGGDAEAGERRSA